MLKFGRFKTSFNILNNRKKKNNNKDHDGIATVMSINGAYRVNRDEYFAYSNHAEVQRKSTPIPPQMLPDQKSGPIRQAKSTSDLIKDKNLPQQLRKANSGISLDPRGAENENDKSRNQTTDVKKVKQLDAEKRVEKQKLEEQKKLERKRLEEQKKLEKQRIEEEKKREKLALQERAKRDKLTKEKEKRDSKKVKSNKKAAPQRPLANPLAQSSTQAANPIDQQSGSKYSTNTLDSSISKTSGPPPYSENANTNRTENENNSNVTFSKPVDTDSWDMISQHRNNMAARKPVNTAPPVKGKVTTLDLNYSLGEQNNNDNSEV